MLALPVDEQFAGKKSLLRQRGGEGLFQFALHFQRLRGFDGESLQNLGNADRLRADHLSADVHVHAFQNIRAVFGELFVQKENEVVRVDALL